MFKKTMPLALTLLALLGAAPLIAACHTVAGAGEDISRTGDAIGTSAKKNTP
ncbi:entericidin A/B family lipoprotein [Zavarzinia sp.]|uniref:entericidin A/B family lipoprotein n=1 Tax=Zavarzinia sp. TaxID=2027920 RepID=UPI003564588B